jgi:hypothetical protein
MPMSSGGAPARAGTSLCTRERVRETSAGRGWGLEAPFILEEG